MPRLPAAELRAMILDAGLQILYENGLSATASHVPMTAALERLEQTHGMKPSMGSIFGEKRLWSNVKQYQIAVLQAALDDHSATGPTDESLVLIDQLPDMRSAPHSERHELLIELCRIAGSINGHLPQDPKRRTWTLWVAIWATAVSDTDNGAQLLPSLAAEEEEMITRFSSLYQIMLNRLGLRIRAPYRLEHLSILAASLTNGMAFRTGLLVDAPGPIRTPFNDAEWNLLGIGFAALAQELIEDDLGT